MWSSSAKWLKLYVEASSSLAFHSAGATPPARADFASSPLQTLPTIPLILQKATVKGKEMCHCETLSCHPGQPRWSPAVSLAG